MQQTLFNVPSVRRADYAIYHDESGADVAHDRFLLQGALFVPISRWQSLLDDLELARDGYTGRIHFVDLRDKTSSKKGLAAWNWINKYFTDWSLQCPYKCQLADRYSSHEQITRHQTKHGLYNYTTVLAIHGGIAWSLTRFQEIRISIYSEETSRSAEDNFKSYVPAQLAIKLNRSRKPGSKSPRLVEPVPQIICVPGNPERTSSDQRGHCEFIQLVDLLTGAVNQAVNANASQEIKIDIGEFVAGWIHDTRRPPWTQSLDLHRRFSVSCFPSRNGGFFEVPLHISQRHQESLFSFSTNT